MVKKSQNTRCSILKASGFLLMTIAWLFLNTMSPVMANSHPAVSTTMQTMDQNGSANHIDHALQSTHQEHAQSADVSSASGEAMKDCVSFSCCLITREEPVFLQAWQYLSPLSFDKINRTMFVEFKPGSQDRPPKHL